MARDATERQRTLLNQIADGLVSATGTGGWESWWYGTSGALFTTPRTSEVKRLIARGWAEEVQGDTVLPTVHLTAAGRAQVTS